MICNCFFADDDDMMIYSDDVAWRQFIDNDDSILFVMI